MTSSAAAIRYRELIITLAARCKLPAIYWERFFVASGGLVSYGVDIVDQYRRAGLVRLELLRELVPAADGTE